MRWSTFALFGALGCAATQRVPVEPILVEKSAVVAPDAVLDLVMAVENPNKQVLILRAIDWELAADDGTPLARGRAELEERLPGRKVTPVTARLPLGSGRAARIGEALSAGPLFLEAILHFSGGAEDVALPLQLDGVTTASGEDQ